MIVETLTWDKVTVEYEKPVDEDGHKSDVFEQAYVMFDLKDRGLRISSKKTDKSILLARAELIAIDAWEAKWTAYWWSAMLESKGFDKLIKAKIYCKF